MKIESFLIDIVYELTGEVFTLKTTIEDEFKNWRHDGPFTIKGERRYLKGTIAEYRKKRAALAALTKQLPQPVKAEVCTKCGYDLREAEWKFNYCPKCGYKLDWGEE